MQGNTHESLTRAECHEVGSDRSFGLLVAGAFVVLALWPLAHGAPLRLWFIPPAAAFLAAALIRPAVLGPLNQLWARLGQLLNRVVSPAVLGLVFVVGVVPVALIFRWSGKDPLRLKFDRTARSYWIPRLPPGPPPESIKNQF